MTSSSPQERPKRRRFRAILTALDLVPRPESSDTPEGRPEDQVIKKRASVAAKGGAWATLLVVVQLAVAESGKWREEFRSQAEAARVRAAASDQLMGGMKASVDTLIAESRAQREFLAFIIANRTAGPIPSARPTAPRIQRAAAPEPPRPTP